MATEMAGILSREKWNLKNEDGDNEREKLIN